MRDIKDPIAALMELYLATLDYLPAVPTMKVRPVRECWHLTTDERHRIRSLIAAGDSTRDISDSMNVSPRTVTAYRRQVHRAERHHPK